MSKDNSTPPIPSHSYLSISIAGGEPQTVVIELFSDKLPITCRNFANLCCAKGATSKKRPLATYRNTEFHRIVPNFMVQGGDFEKFDGTGGYSSFGGTFPDEGLGVISHDQAGVVSMANRGKDTNGSQFFITLEATPHLNGKHVAFGKVVVGMNVIQHMTSVELEGTKPTLMQRIVIIDCGKGRGPVEKISEGTDSDASASRRRKKKDKKKRKHHSKRRKRDRKRHSRTKSESSVSSSSTSEESRHRQKRKKKHTRKRRHEYSSDSDDSSSARRHKPKAKHRRKEER